MSFGCDRDGLLLIASPEAFSPFSNGRLEFRPFGPSEIFLAPVIKQIQSLPFFFGSHSDVVFRLSINRRNAFCKSDAKAPNPEAETELGVQEIVGSYSVAWSRHDVLLLPSSILRSEYVSMSRI